MYRLISKVLLNPVLCVIIWFIEKYRSDISDLSRPFVIQTITGSRGKGDSDIYLIRYILVPKNDRGSIYIHRFLRSDHDVHHDHPWNFWTWVISRGYSESVLTRSKEKNRFDRYNYSEENHTRVVGQRIHRKAEHLHVVRLNRSYKFEERKLAPLTLCFVGKREREWGFLEPPSPLNNQTWKWTDWRTFLGIKREVKYSTSI